METINIRKKHLRPILSSQVLMNGWGFQALRDIAGRGGAPRLATAWETEAQFVPHFIARIVNTEGPGP